MSAEVDARLLNWRFLVPGEPDGLLLLPGGTEALPGAVTPGRGVLGRALGRRYPAVAAPDLAAWAPRRHRAAAPRLLASLAAAVAPGGWLCVGFPNRWYPGAPMRPGSLSSRRAVRTIRRAGLTGAELYAALPEQRRAAFLVPLARRTEMDHMLRVLFDTSFPSGGRGAVAFRRVLSVMRRVALATPRTRRHFVPAYYLVARRPQ
ncbi:MAG: hypothetical protein ACHP9Z_18125 [Streptosporangiales bacterium]